LRRPFHDSDGRWLEGFNPKIGACNALHAEMWGMYSGLDMTWREGASHLIIESDSKVVVDMVTNKCKTNGPSLINSAYSKKFFRGTTDTSYLYLA